MKSIKATGLIAATAAAVLLLAGCEKESNNIVENGPVAARITSTIAGMTTPGGTNGTPATRASGTAWTKNDEIGITALDASDIMLLDNACYVTRGGDGKFEAEDGSVLYFTDNFEVSFTAYYPWTATEKLENGIIQDVLTEATNQAPENQPKIDFLFATAKGSAANADVKLQFRHCMSRLVLNFKPGEGITELDDIEYTLDGMELGGTFNTQTGEAKAKARFGPGRPHPHRPRQRRRRTVVAAHPLPAAGQRAALAHAHHARHDVHRHVPTAPKSAEQQRARTPCRTLLHI